MKKIRLYWRQIGVVPLHIIARKVYRKLSNGLRRYFGKWQADFSSTYITDKKFLQALHSPQNTRDRFVKQIRNRQNPNFFFKPDQHLEYTRFFRINFPEYEQVIIGAANQICNHTFDLLGSGPTNLTPRLDWHCDFKSGYRWNPQSFYTDIKPAHYPGGYDIKVPWELSRCQHFTWLGQAYWFTHDEKYAQEFVAQVTDWIVQNPPRLGVNWVCTMDVAIRAVNWVWGYYFFQGSPELTSQFLLSFFKSLLQHGRHIWENLEFSETFTNNHYLSNIVGLVYLGSFLPEFSEAQRWLSFGLQELEKEMMKQVYPDGANFEASTVYHRLATELFLSVTLLAQLNGHNFSVNYMTRLEKMLEFIMFITKPDGTVPLIGDADNGRLHRLKVWEPCKQEWNDHRYLLAIGAALFNRKDFAEIAGDQWDEALWLLGDRTSTFLSLVDQNRKYSSKLPSIEFPNAGVYVMRHDDMYMLISAGGVGQNGNGGHAHNDVFSFELYVNGCTWVVDPGVFTYTSDYNLRNLSRSTAYHNTVEVDRCEQNRFNPHECFQMRNEAKPKVLTWKTTDTYLLFRGEHYGYTYLPEPLIHTRTIFFDRLDLVWLIIDSMTSPTIHQCRSFLHTDPGVVVTETGGRLKLQHCRQQLFVDSVCDAITEFSFLPSHVFDSYGVQRETKSIAWCWSSVSEFMFAFSTQADPGIAQQQIQRTLMRLREL